jgi:2-dehydro-3-deoxyglucarate aldolase
MKSKLTKKKYILGSWINTGSSIIAEIMSACGFDYLVVDAEHSAVDVSECLNIFQAIKAGNPNCVPFVRLPGNDYSVTKRYLDAGAMGVIAPLINSVDDVKELIRSVKYPPIGERGVGFGRSHGYGYSFNEYMEKANEETFVCIQIEHIKAVENIDKILSVKGIDAVFIGPYDLSASMGITAQFDHNDYIKSWRLILNKCNEYNILPGIHIVQPNPIEIVEKIKDGFKMLAYSLDITMIGWQCRNGLSEIKRRMKNDS